MIESLPVSMYLSVLHGAVYNNVHSCILPVLTHKVVTSVVVRFNGLHKDVYARTPLLWDELPW